MDLIKIRKLPKIYRPGFERSSLAMSEYEINIAKTTFEKFATSNGKDTSTTLNYEELKPLFLHLNLVMSDKILNMYFERVFSADPKSHPSSSISENLQSDIYHIPKSMFSTTVTYDQFLSAFKSILSNQSEYFRAVYNGLEKVASIEEMIEKTKMIIRNMFDKYDSNSNGYIERNELERLFEDLGLKEMYKENFNEFMDQQFEVYDKNFDGVISYEEFIHIHNNLLDDIKGSEVPGHMQLDTI